MIFDYILHIDCRRRISVPLLRRAFRYAPYVDGPEPRYRRESANGLLFASLALVRPDGGAEMKSFRHERLVVVGEIYRKDTGGGSSDPAGGRICADELMDLLQRDRSGFQNSLKGNFQILLFNERNGSCTVWNSRYGISPFYYAARGTEFFCSTSLSELLKLLPTIPPIDGTALTEHALFNYPLHGRTFLTGVSVLQPAEIVSFQGGDLSSRRYWRFTENFGFGLESEADALERSGLQFSRAVNLRAAEPGPICVSLTGGFDGRASLAVLKKSPDDILCYAFGIPGSVNLAIPKGISEALHYRFMPIVLDNQYEKEFDRYADEALFFSDGLSTVERANYPYAFRLLGRNSPMVLTGIFGSELLRTFQNVGLMISPTFVSLNGAPPERWESVLRGAVLAGRYFESTFLLHHMREVITDLEIFARETRDLPSASERFHYFLFTQALRKYFGAEVHMERIYATNRFPYLDDDFVETVFRAPFSGVRSTPLSPTPNQRLRSQYFYAYVIRRFKPELLRYTTDHGFPPADLLRPFPLLWIGPKFLYHRQKRKLLRSREFKTEEWTSPYYHANQQQIERRTPWFTEQLGGELHDGSWARYREEYARAASLKLWLDRVCLGN
jgi:hypothetical protein